jgi:hypothetical protein
LLHKLDLISTGPRASTYRNPVTEIIYCLVSPIIAVLLFNISIINQNGYVDPEFYTGYDYSFSRMWQLYGPTYYAMRFPIMVLNSFFQNLGPGLFGYTLLRLLILWACGILCTSAFDASMASGWLWPRTPACASTHSLLGSCSGI